MGSLKFLSVYKIFLIFLVLTPTFCFASAPEFARKFSFALKKDEWARVEIVQKSSGAKESFNFRWTLFDERHLTLQSFFRLYPRTTTLMLQNRMQHYVQNVLPPTSLPPIDGVSIMVVFSEFSKGRAKFDIGIIDPKGRIDTLLVLAQDSKE